MLLHLEHHTTDPGRAFTQQDKNSQVYIKLVLYNDICLYTIYTNCLNHDKNTV